MATKKNAGRETAVAWAERIANDPRYRDDVDALMTEINLEQDLIALREARGLTQTELAERLGVKQPVISKMESGKVKNIELRTLVRIAAALGARVKIALEKHDVAEKRSAKPKAKKRTVAA